MLFPLCCDAGVVVPRHPVEEAGRVRVELPLHPADVPRPAELHGAQEAQGLMLTTKQYCSIKLLLCNQLDPWGTTI